MSAAQNPLLPAVFDVLWGSVFVAAPLLLASVVVAVITIVSIVRRSPRLGTRAMVLWIALAVVVPAVGAIVWFTAGRSSSALPDAVAR